MLLGSGAYDTVGSGAVHMCGGVAGLAGTLGLPCSSVVMLMCGCSLDSSHHRLLLLLLLPACHSRVECLGDLLAPAITCVADCGPCLLCSGY